MGPDSEGMNKLMHDNLIEIVQKFADQGHSGFSASYAIGLLQNLLAFEPLSDLTCASDEWNDVSDMSPILTWQNKRCSHVFKDGTGRAYDIEGRIFRDPDGSTWTNGDSHVDVTFPYKPAHEYIDREPETSNAN